MNNAFDPAYMAELFRRVQVLRTTLDERYETLRDLLVDLRDVGPDEHALDDIDLYLQLALRDVQTVLGLMVPPDEIAHEVVDPDALLNELFGDDEAADE